MKSKFLFLSLAITMAFTALTGQTDLEHKLFELPDVVFKEIKTPNGFEAAYELKVKQPLDHKNPGAGHFYQRVFLSHRSFDAPAVMITHGYNYPVNQIEEITNYMQGNQIQVEHRYYGASMPDSMDYRYLTLEQMAADLHKINGMFRSLYEGPWLSSGISKGGMTTLFYRYFFPDDVDVSVPYVAPINLAFKDKRIYEFLDTVGSDECRQKIIDFQKHMLKNKDEYLDLVKWYAKGKGHEFERLGIEGAYEYAVLEYSFSFWQISGYACDQIPSGNEGTDSVLTHFLAVSGVGFFSDKAIDGYKPFYYQMGTEMGYYGYETKHFRELIEVLDEEPSAVFPPDNMTLTFDPVLTVKANHWFENELEKVVYINGNSDTWSATAVRPKKELDALVLNMPGKDHRKARIKYMTEGELELLESTLERWLGIDVPAVMP